MKQKFLIGIFALLAMSSVKAESQNPIAKGQAMSWQCAPCHGTNGQEFLEAMPPLAGMPEEQFINAMTSFREGTRPAIIMDRVARGFTDEEINVMAKWFAQQPMKQWQETSLSEAQKSLDATRGQK